MKPVVCDYCNRPAELVTGKEIFPHRPDLFPNVFWRCLPCEAWVGCHDQHPKWSPNGTSPLGRLANAELRRAKNRAHNAFDPLWRGPRRIMKRTEAYKWLARELGISVANCHIGMMGADACRAVVAAVRNRSPIGKTLHAAAA